MSEPKPTVLVVDDESINMDMVLDTLGQDYRVRVAVDGASALASVQKQIPDLVLLDVMMPGMDGFEVCRRMKEEPALRDVPVIFLTALSDPEDEARGLALGAVDYIAKPISPPIVKTRIRNHLELKAHRDRLNALVAQRTREQSAILGNMSDMVWLKDKEGRFIVVNPAFAEACGQYAPEGLVGKTDFDIWPGVLARRYRRDDEKVMKTAKRRTVVEPMAERDGRQRWIETIKTPIYDDEGTLWGMVGIARDITERCQQEEQIREANVMLRTLTGKLAETEERQLKMIARELHDQIGQNLNAIALNLNRVKSLLPEEGRGRVLSGLDDALAITGETTVRIRNLLTEMRSPVMDDYGLLAALRFLADQDGRRSGVKILVQGEELQPRPSAAVENAMYRIAQEALTNVIRHARATEATLTLTARQRKIRLTIADDGVGCDAEKVVGNASEHGWGLITMRERTLAVGGEFRIVSSRGQGTIVTIEVSR
jgi:PAS domain S-box-containing protein